MSDARWINVVIIHPNWTSWSFWRGIADRIAKLEATKP